MGSTNKTSKLRLNQWIATDSPMRADFNADNAAIDSAFVNLENKVDANTASIASTAADLGDELREEFYSELDRVEAKEDETRRFAMDSYNALIMSQNSVDIAALEPSATGVWTERLVNMADIDMSQGATNHNVDGGSPFRFLNKNGWRPMNLGSGVTNTTCGAFVFTLDKPATITAMTSNVAYSERIFAFGQSIYRCTVDENGAVTVGERVHHHTNSYISWGSFANNMPSDANIHLTAGTYLYVVAGTSNQYLSSSCSYNANTEMPPEYCRRNYTWNASNNTVSGPVEGYIPHISLEWVYDDGSLPRIVTKMLDFGNPTDMAVLYVYSSAADQVVQAKAIKENGTIASFAADPNCQHMKVASNSYLSRFVVRFGTAAQRFKLDMGYGSATGGTINRIVIATLRHTD